MTSVRVTLATLTLAVAVASPGSASAQIFLKSPDFSGPPVTGAEPGSILPLPGAKPEELRAGVVWSMRAALNVAALQCQFEPTLLTLNQYNYLISDHSAEFADAYKTLNAYFKRNSKTAKAAQTALDEFGTRTYAGFSTVQSQYGFCLTASRVGRAALFAPRGQLASVASRRLSEIKNSLRPAGEQQFPRFSIYPPYQAPYIPWDPKCWDKKNRITKKCRNRR